MSYYTLETYGGKADGITDNVAAWAAMVAAMGVTSVAVRLEPGTYCFSAAISYTIPAGKQFSIIGAGKGVTTLLWGQANGGLTLNQSDPYATFNLSMFQFATAQVNGGVALKLLNTSAWYGGLGPSSEINSVLFKGALSTAWWGYAIYNRSVSLLNITDTDFVGPGFGVQGTGIDIAGDPVKNTLALVINISNCLFSKLFDSIRYGTFVQGVTVTGCNFSGQNGINVLANATGLAQLAVTNCQFSADGTNIAVQSDLGGTMISNNLFLMAANTQGIVMSSGHLTTITGNIFSAFSATGTVGINIIGSSSLYVAQNANTIVGNTFTALGQAIALQTGSSGWNVQSNAYKANTVNVTDAGTNNKLGGGSI